MPFASHLFNNMEGEFIDNTVVNLSTFELNEHHISLLKHGLKFCPTPPAPDTGQLRADLDRFHTRARQICFFNNKDQMNDLTASFRDTSIETPSDPMGTHEAFKHRNFKSKSKWNCPPGPPNLEAMIVCNEQNFNHRPNFRPSPRDNLTINERKALKKTLRQQRYRYQTSW